MTGTQDRFPGSWQAGMKPSSRNHQTDPKNCEYQTICQSKGALK